MLIMNPLRILSLFCVFFATDSDAHEKAEPNKALFFDKPVAKEMAIQFEIEEDLYPTRGTFEILDFAFLSNEAGERWALAVVYNNVREPRTFTENQLIGFFASGAHRSPLKLSTRIEGGKSETIMIPFGKSLMPLVKLMTRGF